MMTLAQTGAMMGFMRSSFDVDYQALVDKGAALGYTLPSPAQQVKQNALVLSLKSSGVWALLDVFYVYATDGSSEFATLNWKSPSNFQATKFGSPTFTSNIGFTGNGSSMYLDLNWRPSLDAVQYQINNASFFGQFSGTSNGIFCGTFNLSANAIRPGLGNYIQGSAFGSVQTLPAFYTVKRVNNTQASVAKNGAALTTSANAGGGALDNVNWLVLRGGSVYSNVTCGMMAIGSGAITHTDFYSDWNTYFTSI